MCNTVTRTLHTPNVLKLLHQAHIPEASTRGTRHQRHARTPLTSQSNTQSSPPPHRTPNAHAADGARYVNVTHEEAAEEAAATTEAGTAGAGTSAETPTWTLDANLTAHSMVAAHSQANAPSRRAHTIRCPRTHGKRLNSRTKPTERHRHPPVQKLLVAWLIHPALMTCLTRAITPRPRA